MSNQLITPSIIAREVLMQLKNNLVMANQVHRGYEADFATQPNGYKVGSTVTIRKPVKYNVRVGPTMSVQDTIVGSIGITANRLIGVDLNFSVQELTLSISRFSELYLAPAVAKIAQQVDVDLLSLYSAVPSAVGTPGTAISTYANFLRGTTRLNDMAVPLDGRNGIFTPSDRAGLIGALPGLFVPEIGSAAVTQGRLPMLDGIDMRMSQVIRRHTVGNYTGTPLINGTPTAATYAATASNNQQTINTRGWGASITGLLNVGDIITFAGVNAVNPETGDDLGYLRQFAVTATANSDGAGLSSITVTPALVTAMPYRTVTAVPVDGAAITVLGNAGAQRSENMLFHRSAFALAMVPLEPLQGIQGVEQVSSDGFSVTLTPAADPVNYVQRWRADILYGFAPVYPEVATRLYG